MINKILLYDDNIGSVQYIQHMGTDLTIVNSARVSFGQERSRLDEKDKKLIRYLVKEKHTSTFEHNLVTFRFVVPLFIRSQHHRHRTWSYNEISRRYTDIDLNFYEPCEFRTQHKSNRQASNPEELINPPILKKKESYFDDESTCSQAIEKHHRITVDLYKNLIKAGVCREQARGVLSQNLYTQYYGTVNLNNLIKFIDLRTDQGAQWEIQQVAKACLEIATKLWPVAIDSCKERALTKAIISE